MNDPGKRRAGEAPLRLPAWLRRRPRAGGDQLDPATGLLSKAAFDNALEIELERARRGGGPTAVVVAELEGEDRESALQEVGRLVRSGLRCYDQAGRAGEARLAILAAECDEHGAYMLAERMRTQIERTFPGRLTLSLGMAAFPLHGESPESLARAAEQALKAAGRLGGNRAVISSAEVPGVLAGPLPGEPEPQVDLRMLLRLAEALDVRESGSPTHSRRVGRLAELAARELGLAPERVERVRVAGALHDVGRVSVPEDLLRKPGPLTSEEWTLVRTHPEVGARMVETTDFDDVGKWILTHHERPDGGGYPEGVPWDEVPLEGRILGVADAWEAMTSERSYRPALAPDEAARELRRGAGSQFDEGVVEALLRAV
jgi:two-component system, cell cycle response regulator